MLGDRELDFNQYMMLFRRRVWWIAVPTIVAPVLVYCGSLLLANRYTSTTLVLVQQQKVPDEFVKPLITEELNQRLETMQEQILSRSRLQPIIERFGLFRTEIGTTPMEILVDRMRKLVSVTPVKGDFPGNKGLPGFYISFTASEPRLAQQVCGEITSLFVAENLRAREQSVEGTTAFLSSQLDEAKRRLDDQDAKLAAFKARYMGRLPGDEQENLNFLTSLNGQLDATNQAIFRAQQDKSYDEALLAQQLTTWKTAAQPGQDSDSLQKQLKLLQSQLSTLQARYTDDYPDVIKAKEAIAQIRKELDGNESTAKMTNDNTAVGTTRSQQEPTESQQIRLQIHQLEEQIHTKTRQQEDLQRQIKIYQARVQVGPKVEEEFKALTRDYQTALTFYNDLLAKKTRSAMATDLEKRQQGEQFRVLDPPSLPESPTWPNRPLFAIGGIGGGFTLGVAFALFLEMRDRAIRTEQDVAFYLQLPVLTAIPNIHRNGTSKSATSGSWRKKETVAS